MSSNKPKVSNKPDKKGLDKQTHRKSIKQVISWLLMFYEVLQVLVNLLNRKSAMNVININKVNKSSVPVPPPEHSCNNALSPCPESQIQLHILVHRERREELNTYQVKGCSLAKWKDTRRAGLFEKRDP